MLIDAPPDRTGLTLNGDTLTVHSNGTATRTTINNGGIENVLGASVTKLVGESDFTTINNGGVENVNGGTDSNTTINNGGVENVLSGKALGTTINNGGIENVSGMSFETKIKPGGVENVQSGGTSKGTFIGSFVNPGGIENVQSGGTSIGTAVNNGGVENVQSGGTSEGTTIGNGGVENVYGTDARSTIHKGGIENVYGTSIDTIIIGGIENVQSGGTATNVKFTHHQFFQLHATLELATPAGLKGNITDWHVGDVIDFLTTTVTSFQKTGDVLTVTYGNQTASYVLVGLQAHTEFKLESDGHGGTDLILTHIVGSQALHETSHHLFV